MASPVSSSSTRAATEGDSEKKPTKFSKEKEQTTPRRSIRGGADSTTPTEHGGDNRARGEASRRPGDLELQPGVQTPRECLTPRRQVDKVCAADGLLEQLDQNMLNI